MKKTLLLMLLAALTIGCPANNSSEDRSYASPAAGGSPTPSNEPPPRQTRPEER